MKTPGEILPVLALHERWLRKLPGGVRADLTLQDLSSANLPSINLQGAKLPSPHDLSSRAGDRVSV